MWSEPYPANGPLNWYNVTVNWTYHGQYEERVIQTRDTVTVEEMPCKDDEVYDAGVSIRAVNINEDGEALWGGPSDTQSVSVCREPGTYHIALIYKRRLNKVKKNSNLIFKWS